MTLCDDIATSTGVGLFVGVESGANQWQVQNFVTLAKWCNTVGIKTLFIKCFEWKSIAGGTTGMWYSWVPGGFQAIYDAIQPIVNVIPYGFVWGGNPNGSINQEIQLGIQLLNMTGKLCLDVEGSDWQGTFAGMQAEIMAHALHAIPGKIWLSYPANFASADQTPTISSFMECTDVYMPMAYTDSLSHTAIIAIRSLNPQACIHPTLHLGQQFASPGSPNNPLADAQFFKSQGCSTVSLWYQTLALQNEQLVRDIVNVFSSNIVTTPPGVNMGYHTGVVTNSNGNILSTWKWYQLEKEQLPNIATSPLGVQESPDLCGPAAACTVWAGGHPSGGPKSPPGGMTGAEMIDEQTDKISDLEWGTHDGNLGSSVANMHSFLHDLGLNFWDIDTSRPDILDCIRIVVWSGYAVILTAEEGNIIRKSDGQQAYGWDVGNHILACVGIDSQGDFQFDDTMANPGHEWPVTYIANRLQPSWACIVRNPAWMAIIPSGNPKDPIWNDFNCQAKASVPVTTTPNTNQVKSMETTIARFPKLPNPPPQAILDSYRKEFLEGKYHGVLVDSYSNNDFNGNPIWVCEFTHGHAEDNKGTVVWVW